MREEMENLIIQADIDLASARTCMQTRLWYVAAFLAQQAVEKYLQALAMVRLRERTTTHNVVELAERLGAPEEVLTCVRAVAYAYQGTRYPFAANGVPAKQYDEHIAGKHIERAEKAVEWTKQEIGREVGEKGRQTEAIASAEEFAGKVAGVLDLDLALFFGSRVRNDWLVDSDWDLLLVSRDFEGVEFRERVGRVSHLWRGDSLDLLCYTSEEFRKKKERIGTVATAVAEGIIVWKKGG